MTVGLAAAAGVAKGITEAAEINRKSQELADQVALQEKGLNLQERQVATGEKAESRMGLTAEQERKESVSRIKELENKLKESEESWPARLDELKSLSTIRTIEEMKAEEDFSVALDTHFYRIEAEALKNIATKAGIDLAMYGIDFEKWKILYEGTVDENVAFMGMRGMLGQYGASVLNMFEKSYTAVTNTKDFQRTGTAQGAGDIRDSMIAEAGIAMGKLSDLLINVPGEVKKGAATPEQIAQAEKDMNERAIAIESVYKSSVNDLLSKYDEDKKKQSDSTQKKKDKIAAKRENTNWGGRSAVASSIATSYGIKYSDAAPWIKRARETGVIPGVNDMEYAGVISAYSKKYPADRDMFTRMIMTDIEMYKLDALSIVNALTAMGVTDFDPQRVIGGRQ